MTTLDRQQAANILGVSIRTLDRYIKSGKIPVIRKNRRIEISRESLEIVSKKLKPKKRKPNVINKIKKDVSQTFVNFIKQIPKEPTKDDKTINLTKLSKQELTKTFSTDSKYIINYIDSLQSKLNSNKTYIQDLEKKLNYAKFQSQNLNKKIRMERINKLIFIVLFFILLFLQPVFWILTVYN